MREIRAGDYALRFKEKVGTFQTSFFEEDMSFIPKKSDFELDSTFGHGWKDDRYSGNIIDKFMPDTYTDLQNDILGEKQYYHVTIVK